MPQTHKGPTPEIGDQIRPQDADSNRTPGTDQQNHPNDSQPSAGVTQGHHSPQQPKHGRSGEATDRSATGQPQGEDSRNPSSDHNPRTQESGRGASNPGDRSSR